MRWFGIASAVLLAFFSVVYLLRSDWSYAVTAWPPWFWLVPGLLLAALAGKRLFRWLAVGWVVFTVGFMDSPLSLVRFGGPKDSAPAGCLRVVSLNCAAGDEKAASEIAAYHPDVVLLQESPSEPEVRSLAARLFGKSGVCVYGLDTSVLARGRELRSMVPKFRGDFAAVLLEMPDGRKIGVCSLRLMPPVMRFDLWNPGCWSDYATSRSLRRKELSEVVSLSAPLMEGVPCLIGGDFNTSPDDGIQGLLIPRFVDSFLSAGRGWGATGINEIPVARVDQVWLSRELTPVAAYARRTVNSDHQMAVVDFKVRD